MFQDNCSYASTTNVDLIADLTQGNEDSVPRLTLGFMAFTIPSDETTREVFDWHNVCLPYPTEGDPWSQPDGIWQFARVCSFLSLVLGGGATFYLWTSTCCRFQKSSWRWAGAEVALASLFEALSFVWFANGTICKNGTEVCELHYGAKADIMAAIFWALAAIAIFAYFPKPQGEDEQDQRDGVMVGDDHDLALEEKGETATTELEMTSNAGTDGVGKKAKDDAPLQDVQIT